MKPSEKNKEKKRNIENLHTANFLKNLQSPKRYRNLDQRNSKRPQNKNILFLFSFSKYYFVYIWNSKTSVIKAYLYNGNSLLKRNIIGWRRMSNTVKVLNELERTEDFIPSKIILLTRWRNKYFPRKVKIEGLVITRSAVQTLQTP